MKSLSNSACLSHFYYLTLGPNHLFFGFPCYLPFWFPSVSLVLFKVLLRTAAWVMCISAKSNSIPPAYTLTGSLSVCTLMLTVRGHQLSMAPCPPLLASPTYPSSFPPISCLVSSTTVCSFPNIFCCSSPWHLCLRSIVWNAHSWRLSASLLAIFSPSVVDTQKTKRKESKNITTKKNHHITKEDSKIGRKKQRNTSQKIIN